MYDFFEKTIERLHLHKTNNYKLHSCVSGLFFYFDRQRMNTALQKIIKLPVDHTMA